MTELEIKLLRQCSFVIQNYRLKLLHWLAFQILAGTNAPCCPQVDPSLITAIVIILSICLPYPQPCQKFKLG